MQTVFCCVLIRNHSPCAKPFPLEPRRENALFQQKNSSAKGGSVQTVKKPIEPKVSEGRKE